MESDDLIKYGLIPEFIGRLPVITTLDDLDEEALINILTQPKNAIVKQFQYLFSMEEVEIEFTDEALRAIAKQAMAKKTGARGLRSIIEQLLLNTMFELPSAENVEKVIVTEKSITDKLDPEIIYRNSSTQKDNNEGDSLSKTS